MTGESQLVGSFLCQADPNAVLLCPAGRTKRQISQKAQYCQHNQLYIGQIPELLQQG